MAIAVLAKADPRRDRDLRPGEQQLGKLHTAQMREPFRDRTRLVTVAGHINEAGDVFAEDYPFPDVAEGEVLAILNAGGYLRAMSTTHCLRPTGTAIYLDRETSP